MMLWFQPPIHDCCNLFLCAMKNPVINYTISHTMYSGSLYFNITVYQYLIIFIYIILVFCMNDLTANKTQVMCPGCGLGHIWLRYLHPNYIAQI